ncbi:MAG: hypothetical protein R3F61_16830 [Myxococcota bacterium]
MGPALCAGLAAVPALGTEALGLAGLALPGVATVFAAFLGAGLASEDWAHEGPDGTAEQVARGLADAALFGTVAVGLSGWAYGASVAGASGAWAVLLVWSTAAFASLLGPRGALLGLLVWAVVLGGAARMATLAAPWSLLEPSFDSWRGWLSAALGIGALVSWASGQWSSAPMPQPGRIALPNLATGLALLALIGGCLAVGSGWEATLGGPSPGLVRALMWSCSAAGALAVLARAPTTGWRVILAVAGLLTTLWFAGPAASARWTWWAAELPALLGVAAGIRAVVRRDARWGLTSAVLLVGATLSFPGIPKMVLPAAASALPLVFAVWFAGTRAVLRRAA